MCLEQVCSVASGSLDGDESFRVRVIGGSIGIADREALILLSRPIASSCLMNFMLVDTDCPTEAANPLACDNLLIFRTAFIISFRL